MISMKMPCVPCKIAWTYALLLALAATRMCWCEPVLKMRICWWL